MTFRKLSFNTENLVKGSTVCLLIIVMFPVLPTHFLGRYLSGSNWYLGNERFIADLNGIMWLRENSGSEDLILNYQSYSDLFFHAAQVYNVVFSRPTNVSRAEILESIWQNPLNETFVEELLSFYNIKWIYVSSDPRMVDAIHNNATRCDKPFTPAFYIQTFTSYPFLSQTFLDGNCSVFRVSLPPS